MRYLLTISLIFLTFILLGQSGTTLDEYRYLSKGYPYQVEMGLDPTKNGYEIRNNYTAKNGISIIGLYRIETKSLQGLLLVSVDANGKSYYQAIPNPASTDNVLALYQQDQSKPFPKFVQIKMIEAKNHYLFSIPGIESRNAYATDSSKKDNNHSQNSTTKSPNAYDFAPQPQNDQLTTKGGSSIPIESPIGSSNPKSSYGGNTVNGHLNPEFSTRNILVSPSAQNTSNAKGQVMIKFCADANGMITYAKFTQRGSTTLNPQLKNFALDAVRKMRLAPSATNEECGTVGFNF